MAQTTFSGPVVSTGGLATPSTVECLSGSAATAGGAFAIDILNEGDLGIYVGSGAPTISAGQGSLYIRTDGSSTSTRLYVNTDGGTTWTNVTTAA
jgi:hypothetical protein